MASSSHATDAPDTSNGTVDDTAHAEVQDKLREALGLCEKISRFLVPIPSLIHSSSSSAASGGGGGGGGVGLPSSSSTSISRRPSTAAGVVSGESHLPAQQIRIRRSLCAKLVVRVQQLFPVLQRLAADASAVSSDPRASFIIFRLVSELSDAHALLLDCSKGPSLSSLFTSLSISRNRNLSGRIEVCLAEIRQCHTECLILLGREHVRGAPPLTWHAGPADVALSVPTSPMVDRSPRALEFYSVGGFGVDTGGSGSSRAAHRYFSSARPQNASPRALVTRSLSSVDSTEESAASVSGTHKRLASASQLQPRQEQQQTSLDAAGSEPDSLAGVAEARVRQLVNALGYGSVAEKRSSLKSLLDVTDTDEGKLQVAAAGAVPVLSLLLAGEGEATRLLAANVLLRLSCMDENRIVIAKAGCVPSLVALLSSGSPEVRARAARVLWNLAINAENKVIIAATEAIPSLVAIIQSDSEAAAKVEAAEALVQLTSNNPSNQKAVAEAGAIPSLVNMLREGGPKEREKAAFALGMLAVNSDENKLTIAGAGAAPLLLDLLCHREEPLAAKSAAWTLYVLSSHKISATYIQASRGVEIVKEALASGPTEAKYWAGYILSLLEPGTGPPEKVHQHRYSSVPGGGIRTSRQESVEEVVLRRVARERMLMRDISTREQ